MLGNQAGSIRAALERIAPESARTQILENPEIDLAAVAAPEADAAHETNEAVESKITANAAAAEASPGSKEPAEIQVSKALAADAAGDVAAQSKNGIPNRPDRTLVLRILGQLRDRGLDVGQLDGVMGPRTRAAIVTYQRRHGLAPDGIPRTGLLSSLRSTAGGQGKLDTVGTKPPTVEAPAVARDKAAVTDGQVALGAANAGFGVELSAFGTAEATTIEKKRLQETLSDLLGNTELTVERINLGKRGVHY